MIINAKVCVHCFWMCAFVVCDSFRLVVFNVNIVVYFPKKSSRLRQLKERILSSNFCACLLQLNKHSSHRAAWSLLFCIVCFCHSCWKVCKNVQLSVWSSHFPFQSPRVNGKYGGHWKSSKRGCAVCLSLGWICLQCFSKLWSPTYWSKWPKWP